MFSYTNLSKVLIPKNFVFLIVIYLFCYVRSSL